MSHLLQAHQNEFINLYTAYLQDMNSIGRGDLYEISMFREWMAIRGKRYVDRIKRLLNDRIYDRMNYRMSVYPIAEMDNIRMASELGTQYEFGLIRSVEDLILQITNTLLNIGSLAMTEGSGNDLFRDHIIHVTPWANRNFGIVANVMGRYEGMDVYVKQVNKKKFRLSTPDHGFKFCGANVLAEACNLNGKAKPRHFDEIRKNFDRLWDNQNLDAIISKAREKRLVSKSVIFWRPISKNEPFEVEQIGISVDLKSAKLRILVLEGHIYCMEPFDKRAFTYEKKTCENCAREIATTKMSVHKKACLMEKSWEKKNFAVKDPLPMQAITLDPTKWDLDDNKIYQQMEHVLVKDKRCVLIHGPGGGGKSWFIKKLVRENQDLNIKILAPTAKVAQDLGGQTYHSFFKIMSIKNSEKSLHYWRNKADEDEIRDKWDDQLDDVDIILMDEFSMINSSDIDTIDHMLRTYKGRDKLMGGIPCGFFGDPAQLPPVGDDINDTSMLFSGSRVWYELINFNHLVYELNNPRRLAEGCKTMDGSLNLPELQYQFNILEKVRRGETPEELIIMMDHQRFDASELDNLLFSEQLQNGQSVILVNTNDQLSVLSKRIADERNQSYLGKSGDGHVDLYVEPGMEMLITDNQAIPLRTYNGIPLYPNGTRVKVVKWEKNEFVDVEKDGHLLRINRGAGFATKKNGFALLPANIQTIHRMQGATHRGKLYLLHNAEKMSAFPHSKVSAGQMYVALSRTTTMRNVHIICSRHTKMGDILQKRIKAFFITKSILDDVTTPIPMYTVVSNKMSGYGVTTDEQSPYFQYDRKDVATLDGQVYDRDGLENCQFLANTIINDWETALRYKFHANVIGGALATPLCLFKGVPCDYAAIAIEFGYDGYIPKYQYDEINQMMIFSYDTSENPGIEYANFIMGLCEWKASELIKIKALQKKKKKKEYQALDPDYLDFVRHPIREVTFNGGSFDLFIILQNLKRSENVTPHACASGGGFKSFSLSYKKDTLFEMVDLMLLTGVGSLSSKLKSMVEPNIGKDEAFLPWPMLLRDSGTFPDGYKLSENWSILTTEEKLKLVEVEFERRNPRFVYRTKMGKYGKNEKSQYEKRAKTFARWCSYLWMGMDSIRGMIKKAEKDCSPLKYFSQKGKEAWFKKVVNLEEYMKDENGKIDFSKAFFDRELADAKKLYEEDPNYFREYCLRDELSKYCRQDVLCNLMLGLSLNNQVYKNKQDQDEFKYLYSWGGLRTSLVRFTTVPSIAMQISMASIPGELLHKSTTPKTIVPNIQLLTNRQRADFEMVPGGKTQARRSFYKSKTGGRNGDFVVVCDVSGMYMHVMKHLKYPMGAFEYYDKENSPIVISNYQHRLNQKDEKLVDENLYIVGRAKHHDHETENLFSFKLQKNSGLKRSNDWHKCGVYSFQLIEMVFIANVTIEIESLYRFETSGYLTKSAMEGYDEGKRKCEENKDKAGRTLEKLNANATFGKLCQGPNDSKIFFARDDAHLGEICQKYGKEGMRACSQYTSGGFICTVKENDLLANVTTVQGRSILAASKLMVNKMVRIAMGDARQTTSRKKIDDYLPLYGDTDSLYIPFKAVENVVEHDKTKEEKDKILFQAKSDKTTKAGRWTNELADDIEEYAPERAKYFEKDESFPNFQKGYCPRVIEYMSKAPKTLGMKILVPPTGYTADTCPEPTGDETDADEDPKRWKIAYKVKLKGVAKGSYLKINDVIHGEKGPHKFASNKECYELLKCSYDYDIPIIAYRKGDILRKRIQLTGSDEVRGLDPFDIESIPDVPKTIWLGEPNIGRQHVLKKEYEEKDEKDLREMARSEIYESFTVPEGYPVGDLTD